MSTYCKYVINMYNKTKHYLNISVCNEIDYMLYSSYKQQPDIIYLYKFSNGNKYLVKFYNVPIVKKIDNPLVLEILWFLYRAEINMEDMISNIIYNYNTIIHKCRMFNNVNNWKLKNFLSQLSKDDIYTINTSLHILTQMPELQTTRNKEWLLDIIELLYILQKLDSVGIKANISSLNITVNETRNMLTNIINKINE